MEITPDLITQFGLMNKISTGNSAIDVILCLLVPLLIRQLIPKIVELVKARWGRTAKVDVGYTRCIDYEVRSGYYYYYSSDGPRNSVLQTALMNYINRMHNVIRKLSNAEYQLKYKEKAKDGLVEQEENDGVAYDVNTLPPNDEWIDLQNGISFMRTVEKTDEKGKTHKCKYTLVSYKKDGNQIIQDFIDEALEHYRLQQVKKVDPCRYMYVPVLSGWGVRTEGEGNKSTAIYKRYKLSEEKTFASFFHPERDVIMQLVDQFMNKAGKFSIPGYPQKLGFLLHGPPGTGKTSFIKALAQYTKRSIINIPLTKIRTNQELMDIMFDQKIQVEGHEDNMGMAFNKTIFVMEDVDAASDIVHRRSPLPSMTAMMMQMKAQSAQTTKVDKKEGQGKGKEQERRNPDDDDDASVAKEGSDEKEIGPSLPGPRMPKGLLWGGDDDLNLAGLLNILDGVVDTPGRLVIMTTNHPEKLDPALIRPGRINKKIYLGRLAVDQALAMIAHYFGTLAPGSATALREVFVDGVLSPAELEAMCAEYDTTEGLVQAIAAKFDSNASSSSSWTAGPSPDESSSSSNVSSSAVVEGAESPAAQQPTQILNKPAECAVSPVCAIPAVVPEPEITPFQNASPEITPATPTTCSAAPASPAALAEKTSPSTPTPTSPTTTTTEDVSHGDGDVAVDTPPAREVRDDGVDSASAGGSDTDADGLVEIELNSVGGSAAKE